MAARPSMAALILRARTLIADKAALAFSDDEIQTALDVWRTERRWVALRPLPTYSAGGTAIYLDYYSDTGVWEDDIFMQNLSFALITPDIAEPVVGHWHFNVQPLGIGVRATGKTYDIYASCADLLDAWAAQVKLDFTFGAMQDRFERQGKFDMLTTLAARYHLLAQAHVTRLIQTDAASDNDGSGVTYPTVMGSYD